MSADDKPAEGRSGALIDDLQHETMIIRQDLGQLIGELTRRRHRAAMPLALIGLGLAAGSIAGVVVWLVLRGRPSRMRLLAKALERVAAHPERVATPAQPKATRKIAVAAASAAATVVARHLAKRWMARRDRRSGLATPQRVGPVTG